MLNRKCVCIVNLIVILSFLLFFIDKDIYGSGSAVWRQQHSQSNYTIEVSSDREVYIEGMTADFTIELTRTKNGKNKNFPLNLKNKKLLAWFPDKNTPVELTKKNKGKYIFTLVLEGTGNQTLYVELQHNYHNAPQNIQNSIERFRAKILKLEERYKQTTHSIRKWIMQMQIWVFEKNIERLGQKIERMGKTLAEVSKTISVNAAPVIAVTNPLEGSFLKGTVNVFVNSDSVMPGTAELVINSNTYDSREVAAGNFTYEIDTEQFADGEYEVSIKLTLADNGYITESENVLVVFDNTAPQITGLIPADNDIVDDNLSAITVLYNDSTSGINTGSVELIVAGVDRTSETDISGTGLVYSPEAEYADGNVLYSVIISDNAGNFADAAAAFIVETVPSINDMIDNTQPGDTVLLEPDTYEETISIDKEITLSASPGQQDIIIKGGLVISAPITGTVTVENIKFESTGGPVIISNDINNTENMTLVVRNCEFSGTSNGIEGFAKVRVEDTFIRGMNKGLAAINELHVDNLTIENSETGIHNVNSLTGENLTISDSNVALKDTGIDLKGLYMYDNLIGGENIHCIILVGEIKNSPLNLGDDIVMVRIAFENEQINNRYNGGKHNVYLLECTGTYNVEDETLCKSFNNPSDLSTVKYMVIMPDPASLHTQGVIREGGVFIESIMENLSWYDTGTGMVEKNYLEFWDTILGTDNSVAVFYYNSSVTDPENYIYSNLREAVQTALSPGEGYVLILGNRSYVPPYGEYQGGVDWQYDPFNRLSSNVFIGRYPARNTRRFENDLRNMIGKSMRYMLEGMFGNLKTHLQVAQDDDTAVQLNHIGLMVDRANGEDSDQRVYSPNRGYYQYIREWRTANETQGMNLIPDLNMNAEHALLFYDANNNNLWDYGEDVWKNTQNTTSKTYQDEEWLYRGGDGVRQVEDGDRGIVGKYQRGRSFNVLLFNDLNNNNEFDPEEEEIWFETPNWENNDIRYDGAVNIHFNPGYLDNAGIIYMHNTESNRVDRVYSSRSGDYFRRLINFGTQGQTMYDNFIHGVTASGAPGGNYDLFDEFDRLDNDQYNSVYVHYYGLPEHVATYNTGKFGFLAYVGHGEKDSFGGMNVTVNKNDILTKLSNQNNFPVVYSIACLTGQMGYGDNPNMGESFVLSASNGNPAGGVGFIGFTLTIEGAGYSEYNIFPYYQNSINSPGLSLGQLYENVLAQRFTEQLARTVLYGDPALRLQSSPELEKFYMESGKASVKWDFTSMDQGKFDHSSPAIGLDGAVYFHGNSNLYAFEADGSMLWSKQGRFGEPVIGNDGTLYVIDIMNRDLYALNPANGDEIWPAPFTEAGTTPVIGLDNIIITADAVTGRLYGIEPNGTEKWSYPVPPGISVPSVGKDGTLYFGVSDGLERNLYALSSDPYLSEGERLLWTFVLDARIQSPSIGRDGTLYVCTHNNKLIALSPDPFLSDVERILWGPIDLGDDITNSPVIGEDGTLYITTLYGTLFAIDPADGLIKWTYSVETELISSPAIGKNGMIYLPVYNGDIHVLKTDPLLTDTQRLQLTIPDLGIELMSNPAIADDGTLYIGTWVIKEYMHAGYHGKMYAIFTSSEGLADSAWPMYKHDARHSSRAD